MKININNKICLMCPNCHCKRPTYQSVYLRRCAVCHKIIIGSDD